MRSSSVAFFHEVTHSALHPQRFCLWHRPLEKTAAPATALIVYVHPFAEEMNKSRRMAALQSRALADAGCAVLQMDLLGCGDSAGDFGDASWDEWIHDVVQACDVARRLHAETWPKAVPPTLWLWGLRAGCLLASAAAQRMAQPCNFLFWQPSVAGKLVLQQFLRLKVAAAMGQADTRGVSGQLRNDLAAQLTVHVAGYKLAPGLSSGLERALLDPPAQPGKVLWLEASLREEASLLPASGAVVARWQGAGHDVGEHVVAGPAFWSTVEIEDAPDLLAATTTLLLSAGVR